MKRFFMILVSFTLFYGLSYAQWAKVFNAPKRADIKTVTVEVAHPLTSEILNKYPPTIISEIVLAGFNEIHKSKLAKNSDTIVVLWEQDDSYWGAAINYLIYKKAITNKITAEQYGENLVIDFKMK